MGRFKETEIKKIVEELRKQGGVLESPPEHAIYRIRFGNSLLTVYKTGAVVYGGKDKEKLKKMVVKIVSPLVDKTARLGCDESGKGEYVGPLVVAAVFADETGVEELISLGVDDSKKLTDNRIIELSDRIKKKVKGKVKVLMPETYNKLYTRFKNLNLLLDNVYCDLISELYKKHNFRKVVVDKYSNTLEGKLKKVLPEEVDVVVVNKAEEDPVVAAASIIAKGERIKKMKFLEEKYGVSLPKGNNREEIRKFLDSVSDELLPYLVKLHFNIRKGDGK